MDAVPTAEERPPPAARHVNASDADAAERATPRQRYENTILGTVAVIIFLVIWEGVVDFGLINPLFTSSPSRIAVAGYDLFANGTIWRDLQVSGLEFFAGYGLAVIVGVPLGILMGWYSRVNAILDPFVSALYATPRIALLPLVMIWFGIGLLSKVAIVFLGAVFPILVNTITGVRTINADFIKVARSFGSNDWQFFLKVALPSSVPLLLAGLRLGLGHALIGIVVGEMFGATEGLGFLIAVSGARFQTDRVMVGIIIIAAAGMAMTAILRAIERRFERWRPDVRG
jgi:ABC-type nitrate/sulfonate/bicarbonate transport system permease component